MTTKSKNVKLFDFEKREVSSADKSIPVGVWLTGAELLWKAGFTGKNCVIGVIDTGIDGSHEDLKNKVIKRKDYVKDGSKESDFNPHGTHVAGIICANGKIKGVAPDAKLVDYRVLDKYGYGYSKDIITAIIDATNDGCNIINLSLGTTVNNKRLASAIKYAISRNVLVVAASGNSGPNTFCYPAAYPGVVCVGAVDYNTTFNKIDIPVTPWFSSSNKFVSIACDGWKVLSCFPRNSYAELSGTSMATPHASGIAALLWCQLKSQSSSLSYYIFYNRLLKNTIDILSLGRDDISGLGLLTFYTRLPVYT